MVHVLSTRSCVMKTNVGAYAETDQQHGNTRSSGSSRRSWMNGTFALILKKRIMEWFEMLGTVFFVVMVLKFGNSGRGLMER
jgi:hypothetical protein